MMMNGCGVNITDSIWDGIQQEYERWGKPQFIVFQRTGKYIIRKKDHHSKYQTDRNVLSTAILYGAYVIVDLECGAVLKDRSGKLGTQIFDTTLVSLYD